MKKYFNIALLFVIACAFASCNDDNSKSEYVFQEQIYYRVVNNTNPDATPFFARSMVNVTVDYAENTISFSAAMTPNNNGQITFETSTMKYTLINSNTFKFTGGTVKAEGHTVSNLSGYYDSATNAIYFEMNVDGARNIYATSTPLFPYTKTIVANNMSSTDSSEPMELDDCFYGFIFDNTLVDGVFAIMNFKLTPIDSRVEEIDFKGIKVTPTADGYSIEASLLPPSLSGSLEKYTISDFKADITEQGCKVQGSFTCYNKDVTFSGKTFNIND